MRSLIRSLSYAALGFTVFALAPAAARAQQKPEELPADREEIVVTHSPLGPLSEWAQMQQHTAEYQRLKAKFDPTQGSSHVDNWANDRALATHNNGDSFMDESAQQPTPPAVQAVKDAVVPP
jgi:hypothetical protein